MAIYKLSAILEPSLWASEPLLPALATSDSTITLGNGMLIVSIIMMGFGYSKWQP